MRVLLVGQHDKWDWADNSGPSLIRRAGETLGHSFVSSFCEEPHVVLFVDWHKSMRHELSLANTRRIPTILIKYEPSVVIPGNRSDAVDAFFSKTIEVGRPEALPQVKWPQTTWNLEYFDSQSRVERVVAINANKYSCVRGELYSLRSMTFTHFSEVDVYGTEWTRSKTRNVLKFLREFVIALDYRNDSGVSLACASAITKAPRNYLGSPTNKRETLSHYTSSLVIENSSEYMTEKLFDSLLSGTIPIYVGPAVHKFGIPPLLVVQSGSTLEDIQGSIGLALSMDHEKWKEQTRKWLTSPGVQEAWDARFSSRKVFEVAEALSL